MTKFTVVAAVEGKRTRVRVYAYTVDGALEKCRAAQCWDLDTEFYVVE